MIHEWLKWLGSEGPFIPVSKYRFTAAQGRAIESFGYRYGFNRVVGPGERGQYVGYFAPEAIDKDFVDGRAFVRATEVAQTSE